MNQFFSPQFLYYVKFIIVLQIIIVLLFLIFTYISRAYLSNRKKKLNKLSKKLKEKFTLIAQGKEELSSEDLEEAGKSIEMLLSILTNFDPQLDSTNWAQAKAQLISEVILPKARKLTNSKRWFNRYLAAQCFYFGKSKDDDIYFIQLINDPILLISLNAAGASIRYPSQAIIDTVIEQFSKGRRTQQISAAKILASSESQLAPYVYRYLEKAKDPYAIAFCYRLLSFLPRQQQISKEAYDNIHAPNLELRITALKYLAHNHAKSIDDILINQLDSQVWQIRAIAVSLLSELKKTSAVQHIASKLNDPEWWVRVNAAEALARLGESGIEILKSQRPDKDKYAYETALQVLKTRANRSLT